MPPSFLSGRGMWKTVKSGNVFSISSMATLFVSELSQVSVIARMSSRLGILISQQVVENIHAGSHGL